jgi:hypothetical protein
MRVARRPTGCCVALVRLGSNDEAEQAARAAGGWERAPEIEGAVYPQRLSGRALAG